LNYKRFFAALIFLVIPYYLAQAQNTIQWSEFESRTDDLFQQNGSVGASVIVVSRDSIMFQKGFGFADIESNIEITDSTLFVLGSITKTFTALGILKLVEDGKLALGYEVKRLAPELPVSNKWEDKFPLRVFHLLEHTSGFDELHLKDRSIPVLYDEFPLIEGISIVKNSLETRWQPGTRFAYSNVGYLLAGYLIEKVSGITYNDFIVQEVLGPMEMVNSTIQFKDINQQQLAKSYSYSKKALPFKHIFTRPTGSLISSTRDMGQFLQVLLQHGESFISKETFNAFEKHRSIKAFEGTVNGYRLGIYPRFHKGRIWLGHGGSINKYNSEFEYNHELGLGIFVVSNGPNTTKTVDDILNTFHDLIPDASENKVTFKETSSISNLRDFNGYYMLVSPRNQLLFPFNELFTEGLFINTNNETISISNLSGWESELIRTGANTFSQAGTKNEYQFVFENSTDILYTSLGTAYKKIPIELMLVLTVLLTFSMLVICLSQITFLIRIINFIKTRSYVLNPQLTFEIGALIMLVACIIFLIAGLLDNIHEPNLLAVMLFLCTILFPLLTAFGVAQLLKYNFEHLLSKVWAIMLAISTITMSSYLIYWELLGFAIWKY